MTTPDPGPHSTRPDPLSRPGSPLPAAGCPDPGPLLDSLALAAARGALAVADGTVRITRGRLTASILANDPIGLTDIAANTYILAAHRRRAAQEALDALAPPPSALDALLRQSTALPLDPPLSATREASMDRRPRQ